MFDTQQSYLKPFCNKIDFLGKLWPISGNAQALEFATQWDLVQGTISNYNQSSETIYTLVHTRGQGSQAAGISIGNEHEYIAGEVKKCNYVLIFLRYNIQHFYNTLGLNVAYKGTSVHPAHALGKMCD